MKIFIALMCAAIIFYSCKKAQIQPTRLSYAPVPWIDSSNIHPKSAAFTALLKKYHDKGLPGISLVSDANGTG